MAGIARGQRQAPAPGETADRGGPGGSEGHGQSPEAATRAVSRRGESARDAELRGRV